MPSCFGSPQKRYTYISDGVPIHIQIKYDLSQTVSHDAVYNLQALPAKAIN